ncbi:hypothetical protein SAMN04488032_103261 [Pacificibacter marinus]|nr:hypothetical protein SAMN04488032_103261 [Pacificibacter marinus]
MPDKREIKRLKNMAKTTRRNALTKNTAEQTANEPEGTIDPNPAKVKEQKSPLEKRTDITGEKQNNPTHITVRESERLVKKTAKTEGKANQVRTNNQQRNTNPQMARRKKDKKGTQVEARVETTEQTKATKKENKTANRKTTKKHQNGRRRKIKRNQKDETKQNRQQPNTKTEIENDKPAKAQEADKHHKKPRTALNPAAQKPNMDLRNGQEQNAAKDNANQDHATKNTTQNEEAPAGTSPKTEQKKSQLKTKEAQRCSQETDSEEPPPDRTTNARYKPKK